MPAAPSTAGSPDMAPSDRHRVPLIFIILFLAALVIQANPGWREQLIYERRAIAAGDLWRLWTGHLVHFGWMHCIADSGLLLMVGWAFGRDHPWAGRLALVLMPLFVSLSLYWFDPAMTRYAGLSAVDLGLLLLLAGMGWQRKWTDWFWPAILLLYVAEMTLEIVRGGRGGGVITFDEPNVQVATSAHLAAAAYAALAWSINRYARKAILSVRAGFFRT